MNTYARIIFVDDKTISRLAGEFRSSPYPTDVLAFCYKDTLMEDEIFVSIDTAKRQAKNRDVFFEDELLLLCVHGLLHIGGKDDETVSNWCKMRIYEFETMMRVL